ncbi:hypothetical protein [Pseudonocardia acaciae]|uniref:hypothetical protein n=1 Tax=Pseudonocardia acaciae TaxID=551276 RepID=UPI001B80B059
MKRPVASRAFDAIQLPAGFWERSDTREALRTRDVGMLFRLVSRYAGASQTRIGVTSGIPQGKVSEIMKGKRRVESFAVLGRIADGLDMPDRARAEFGLASRVVPQSSASTGPGYQDIDTGVLVAELADSSVSDEVIGRLSTATASLAEAHTQAPATRVLAQVLRLHREIQTLLRCRQRLSQKRELFRIESELLAHACLLFGDLKQDYRAEKCGAAALEYAREAGTNQALAWTALAKTLRWEERLVESADVARKGFECSPHAPVRIQLASQEANAAALLGDCGRAREALKRAEHAAETVPDDSGMSAWSFPVARQALFALSVAAGTGDPQTALRAASTAEAEWRSGGPRVRATWAQVRMGAGIAHLMNGSLDEVVEEVTPVLTLPPELRVATVTAYVDRLDRSLGRNQFRGSKMVLELRKGLREFSARAVSTGWHPETE